jgi:hypothetical protein
MTIATSASTSAGTSTVTVTGTSGSLSHFATVSLIVANPASGGGNFLLAISQDFSAGTAAGGQTAAEVSLTSAYAGSVTANCDASAISGQCVIRPANPVAIQANDSTILTLTLNVPNTIAPGTYNVSLTVAGSSGAPGTIQLPFTVIPDFSVAAATSAQTLTAGQTTSGPYQLTVAPNPPGSSFAGAVTLSCTHGMPAGAQCSFAPAAPVTLGINSAAVVMTISTATSQAMVPSLFNRSLFCAMWLLFPGILIVRNAVEAGSAKRTNFALGFMMLFLLTLLSCGGVSNGGSSSGTGGTPTTYQITITGESAGTPADSGQSTLITLVVD